jgi:hypothetical protein
MKAPSAIASIMIAVIVLSVYGLNRGIYLGSSITNEDRAFTKRCRYLFISGISEIPAQGGPLKDSPGWQPAHLPDQLYCRFFAE